MFTKENIEEINHILPYIKAYLNEVSSIIESKYTLELLHNQNIKDPLTGLFNRRYFENILTHLIANAKRRNTKLGFLMLDMDYFKKVNDRYGHDAGDMILKQLAYIIKNSIRESDIAIRFGGEEFLILLTNLENKDGLLKAAEKIRSNIENYKFDVGKENIQKTVSIGASLFPDDCSSGWECVKYADIALYEAKRQGRNRVVLFTEKLKEESNYKD
jgi:diguanylate cyclase (GGDEF)-like protein